jgi:peptide/nickel transport system substrate-binding protein
LRVTQRVVPVGPLFAAIRNGNFDVLIDTNCNSLVNPLLDVQKYLPHSVSAINFGNYDDQKAIDLYQRMLHETDGTKQRALMRDFEKHVLDTEAHEIVTAYWYRIVPAALVREGPEGRPEPLRQSGPRQRLA